MKKALLFALTLQASGLAFGADNSGQVNPEHRWYQADVIVFRHLDTTSDEAWPAIEQHHQPATTVSLKSPVDSAPDPLSGNLLEPAPVQKTTEHRDIVRDEFISLPASEFVLGKESASLSRSNRYQILSQTAWRMPVDSSLKDIPVRINASATQDSGYLLEGTITISASRFLHVDADLWLSELAPEALSQKLINIDNETSGNALDMSGQREGMLIRSEGIDSPWRITGNFPLKQRRRIRNTAEVQYLDTPVIGVIVKLTSYDRPNNLLEVIGSELISVP